MSATRGAWRRSFPALLFSALVLFPAYDIAIVGDIDLTPAQVAMVSRWVGSGGDLIAMRPDAQLAGLLGLTFSGSSISEAYLKVDTGGPPGAGIVGTTMQFHGAADRYALHGARSVAGLYADASTPLAAPAITTHNVGSRGGSAAAFAFDLARSVAYTRQGNPAWAGQKRDGMKPVRADDLFFGHSSHDAQPDWVDPSRIAIPQADEQQRLLANLIGEETADKKPLPRFWYLPRGLKAAVVMTGDDHGRGGTAARFEKDIADSPAGCDVSRWECIRRSSYVYADTPLSDAAAARSDWSSLPKTELAHGMRLDSTYYNYPGGWVQDHPGFFTGSGMPMRFVDVDGKTIDVYQAATQMTDESGESYPERPA